MQPKQSQYFPLCEDNSATISKLFPALFKTFAWHNLEIHKRDTNRLDQVQRRAADWAISLKHEFYKDKLWHLGLFSLSYWSVRGDLIMTHNISGLLNHSNSSILSEHSHHAPEATLKRLHTKERAPSYSLTFSPYEIPSFGMLSCRNGHNSFSG